MPNLHVWSEFFDIAVEPMPILQPGQVEITFTANLSRGINENLVTNINVIRTVAGFTLPIRWYHSIK